MHLFKWEIGSKLVLVDLPGYGFAGRTPKEMVAKWSHLVDGYLSKIGVLMISRTNGSFEESNNEARLEGAFVTFSGLLFYN